MTLGKSGPAACRDHGARLATNEWLCFVDSDVLVHHDAFAKSISILSQYGDDGLVGSYDESPEDPGVISRFRNLLHHYHHQRNEGATGVFWGAFGIVRKSAYLDAGGFDPSYRQASVEDIELGYRLFQKGYRIVLRPEVQVKHLKKWTLWGMVRTDVLLRARPWTLLLHRYRNRHFGSLNTAGKERASAILAASGALLLAGLSTGVLPFMPYGITLTAYIILQWHLYAFLVPRFSVLQLPTLFLLHQLYYLSAMAGWLMARTDILSERTQSLHHAKGCNHRSRSGGPDRRV
jgi:cellulose synthase/poly-beta-1,6-N-acetylglucosamine synthase-like glycosyltransferase